jgi:hypothetical protein
MRAATWRGRNAYGSRARLILLRLQSEALRTQSRDVELGRNLNFDLYHIFVAPKLGGGGAGHFSLPAPCGPALKLAPISSNRIGDDLLIEMLRPDLLQPLRRLAEPSLGFQV